MTHQVHHPRSLVQDQELLEGGAFDYDRSSELFLGRTGVGPLRVAVDTAVLIDFGNFGELMWADEPFDPDISEPTYRRELLALDRLMELWLTRDIRLHVFDSQLFDAKRQLTGERAEQRCVQLEQLHAALDCLGHGTAHQVPEPGEAWPSGDLLLQVGGNVDGELVRSAFTNGCHVFLTRDAQVLNRSDLAKDFGLQLFAPSHLLRRMTDSAEGSTDLMFGDGGFLLPDTHKWAHGMAACGV